MKKRILTMLIIGVVALMIVSCGKETDDSNKANATATPLPTAIPTEAPKDPNEITSDEMAAVKSKMPAKLPGDEEYEIFLRNMCFDYGKENYTIAGNSKGTAVYVGESEGAIYGQALKFAAKNDTEDKRGEVEMDLRKPFFPEGAKGVLFYVDFSAVAPKEEAAMCASVTMNINDVRGNKPENGSVGYYFADGEWHETHNVTACRMAIPNNFKGWIYVPATSYIGTNGESMCDADGRFTYFPVTNMRCYTDGYTYDSETYIIFDEITFVK